ncbi:hypothetical protein TNCV_1933281 [Trichonephila clavipes]|nr:hypothetical protein TNCV_1933281 [Trichonephila clavipes]
MTATAGSDVVQSGRPIFDDFFQHLLPYIGNNRANVVFQMVKRLWLIRLHQENVMAIAFWVSVRNNISKRWNTTENDASKNQSSADSAIRLPNISILNSNAADITE